MFCRPRLNNDDIQTRWPISHPYTAPCTILHYTYSTRRCSVPFATLWASMTYVSGRGHQSESVCVAPGPAGIALGSVAFHSHQAMPAEMKWYEVRLDTVIIIIIIIIMIMIMRIIIITLGRVLECLASQLQQLGTKLQNCTNLHERKGWTHGVHWLGNNHLFCLPIWQ